MTASVPRRVLVVRTDKVGDLILSTPAILSVRRACPGAHLVVAVSPYNRPSIDGWSVPDDVVEYDPQWPVLRRRAVYARLANAAFDLALVLQPALVAYRLGWATRATRRVGVVHARRLLDRIAARLLLTDRVVARVEGDAARGRPVPHEVALTRAVVERAGLPWGGDALASPPRHPDRESALSALLARSRTPEGRVVGVHLADKWLTHGWGLPDVERLLLTLAGVHGDVTVLATAGCADARILDGLRQRPAFAVGTQQAMAGVLSGAGGRVFVVPVDFPMWSTVLGRCTVVISPDTGAVHLAASLGRAVVAVYAADRAGVNMGQFAPWGVPFRSFVHAEPGRLIPAIVDAAVGLTERGTPHADGLPAAVRL